MSRDREGLSVTGGVRVKQAQLARIPKFSRLLNYIYVTFLELPQYGVAVCERLATELVGGLLERQAYLSGTADGEMTASATSFMVIRRSMAAR